MDVARAQNGLNTEQHQMEFSRLEIDRFPRSDRNCGNGTHAHHSVTVLMLMNLQLAGNIAGTTGDCAQAITDIGQLQKGRRHFLPWRHGSDITVFGAKRFRSCRAASDNQ